MLGACVHMGVAGQCGQGGACWENLSLNRSHVKSQTCWLLQADLSFPEPVRDRCYAGFEVGPMSLTCPVGNAWQLPVSLWSAFKIALSIPGSRAPAAQSLPVGVRPVLRLTCLDGV